jgi:uncharacterized protein (TIGR03435 family)
VPTELDAARYDYIDTMPQGGRELLQRELKDRLGLVARLEMRTVETLVMTVKNPDATGLKKSDTTQRSVSHSGSSPDGMTGDNLTMATLAARLGGLLGVNVMDQTGLSDAFNFKLVLPRNETPDDNKQAVFDQLGLELIPAAEKQSVEFLVAEKVR